MARRVSAARVKAKRTYTIEEAAEVAGVSLQTIRSWIKSGLPAMTEKRPYLILGSDLRARVDKRRAKPGNKLKVGEFFCFRCKGPCCAALEMVDLKQTSPTTTLVCALCDCCEGPVNRFVAAADLPEWARICDIVRNEQKDA